MTLVCTAVHASQVLLLSNAAILQQNTFMRLPLRSDCMSLIAGESVAKYIRQPSPYNTQIVALGVDTYLKMLLHDNFVVSSLASVEAVSHCSKVCLCVM